MKDIFIFILLTPFLFYLSKTSVSEKWASIYFKSSIFSFVILTMAIVKFFLAGGEM